LLGLAGPQSDCEPYREIILAKVQEDLSAKRIWQDLGESGATLGYDSVRRFIQRLGRVRSLPFRRMECGPGEEAQVDFGSGAPVIRPDGKCRRTHVFRIVLSHSRKAYSEATFTQTVIERIKCSQWRAKLAARV
jgi:transposase